MSYAEQRGRVDTTKTIHGVNPAFLIDKVVRERIQESRYYKEECFALDCATWCDRAVDVEYVGGTFGTTLQASPFICLIFALIQLQPEQEILQEYLSQKDFKYLTAAALVYVRLTFNPDQVYKTIEPFLNDYRKLRLRKRDGSVMLSYMDEFSDMLLNDQRVCDITLPPMPSRVQLEDQELLEPRESKLASELDSSEEE